MTQTLTLSASTTIPTGTYRLRVRGTSGSLTREADLTLTVTAPSPSLVMVLEHDLWRCPSSPTFTGTLEGTPTAPLRLQYALKPKGAQDFGPWQDAGEMQVSGNQATLVLSQPPYPEGIEGTPWQIRIRVLMGDQPWGSGPGPTTRWCPSSNSPSIVSSYMFIAFRKSTLRILPNHLTFFAQSQTATSLLSGRRDWKFTFHS